MNAFWGPFSGVSYCFTMLKTRMAKTQERRQTHSFNMYLYMQCIRVRMDCIPPPPKKIYLFNVQPNTQLTFRGNVSAPGARRASFVTRALLVDRCR